MNRMLAAAVGGVRLLVVMGAVLAASTTSTKLTLGQEAGTEPSTGPRQRFSQPKDPGATEAETKVSSVLRSVLAAFEARGITRANARARGASALSNFLVHVDADGAIQTYLHMPSFGEGELATLRQREVVIEIANEELGMVQAWIPFDRIDAVASLGFVTRITPPKYATPRAGSVVTEGDAILRADALRALGFDGTGVKVGVISTGANHLADAQATGDLPSGITVFGTCTPRPFLGCSDFGRECDEGTAMMEIIHDMAPGAELGFGAVNTDLEFIQRVDDLVNTFGADIVVDDLGFFGEPYFEDGAIAQAVAAVADQVVFVSSAGNAAGKHYEADYVDSGNAFSDHDFGQAAGGSSDSTMNVLVGAGGLLVAILQWTDRFGLSANDYDLLLLNETEASILAASVLPQDGNDDPIEFFCFPNNTGSTVRTKIVVERFSGASRRLEMFLLRNLLVEEYGVSAGSVFGHAGVAGVIATAAIDASDPENDTIEPFSSRGPSRIDFPSLQIRQKPDVTAIDGVSVTGVGGFASTFFGTSAAAPHVAGVAALLLHSAASATPARIRNALTRGAVGLGASGRDNTFGSGRVDALAAFEAMRPGAMPWLLLLLLD